ncbi:unnamed protein product, partial [marine sediment metagenome]
PYKPLIEYSLTTPGISTAIIGIGQISDDIAQCQLSQNITASQLTSGMKLSLDKFKLGEIYYNLSPDNWGQGYATEIAKTLVKLGFEDLKLHKVEAGVATENVRSIGVLEKAGMTREGLRRKILPIRGVWKDNYHYAIVEDDSRDF